MIKEETRKSQVNFKNIDGLRISKEMIARIKKNWLYLENKPKKELDDLDTASYFVNLSYDNDCEIALRQDVVVNVMLYNLKDAGIL